MTSVSHFRVIPVLVIEDASWASDLGACLVQSGLPVVEVTLRTPQSWSAAEAMRKIPGLTVGIGSVTKVSDLDRKSTRLNSSHVSESRMPSSA